MTNLYPYGYGSVRLSWDQMMTKSTVYNLHPELRRRFHALIDYAHSRTVSLGVGTGWRVQPNPPPPGFASPGNSWHESCPVSPTSQTALAIDTVPTASWPWMENNCKAYGLRTFKYVNNEPWHIQLVETPTSRKYARTLPPINTNFVLPTTPGQPSQPGPTPPTQPVGKFTLQLQKTTLDPSNQAALRGNGDVFLIQYVAAGLFRQTNSPNFDCGKPDGDYGPRTQTAVREIQKLNQLTQDAICGPQTWGAALNSDGA